MTSKEALDKIYSFAFPSSSLPSSSIETSEYRRSYYERLYILIEKDLKVLEMLKKNMTIEIGYYDSDLGCETFEYIAYNGEALSIESQEEFDLLKEFIKAKKVDK